MPGVTVEEIWRLALPPGTSLAAGEAGLGHEVSWPALLRSRPPAFDPLRGGEMALVSMQSARMLDERLTLSRIIRSLVEANVAAVAVVGEIDDEAKHLAESARIALFLLPPGSNLHRVEQSVTRTVIDRRAELYQRSQQIYQQLTELVIAGRGVPAIIERLAELTGRPVALEDDTLVLRAYAPSSRGPTRDDLAHGLIESQDDVLTWLRTVPPSASDPPTAKFSIERLGLARVVAPVVSRDKISGYLSILGRNGELGELEQLAVSRGAAACAIEMVKEWAVLEAEDRLQGDLIDDLLGGEFTSVEALQSRAKRLGFDLHRPYAVFVFQLSDQQPVAAAWASGDRSARVRTARPMALDKLLERELANRGVTGLVGTKGDVASVLYPLTGGTDPITIKNLASDLRQAIATQCDTPLSVGVGRFQHGIDGMRAAHREAQQALAVSNRLFGGGKATYFGDLGLYRLILGVKDNADLQAFYQETLAKLVAYDGRNDGELVKTLDAYFASHHSPTDAARRLHLHRNTLLYRLRRIQEITGLDLDDAEVCLALHLALRVGDVLRAISPQT